MSDRPTPETDAVRAYEGNWDTKALRMTAHARKLERERDELREKYDQICSQTFIEINKVCDERDEAIAARKASATDWLGQIEQANARVSRALQQVATAERERDEAREAATEQFIAACKAREQAAKWLARLQEHGLEEYGN